MPKLEFELLRHPQRILSPGCRIVLRATKQYLPTFQPSKQDTSRLVRKSNSLICRSYWGTACQSGKETSDLGVM